MSEISLSVISSLNKLELICLYTFIAIVSRQFLLSRQRGKNTHSHPNVCPGYDGKQSDG